MKEAPKRKYRSFAWWRKLNKDQINETLAKYRVFTEYPDHPNKLVLEPK